MCESIFSCPLLRLASAVACRSCTTVGPSVAKNKYVNRVTVYSLLYSNHVKYSTVRSLREIDVLVQKSTV